MRTAIFVYEPSHLTIEAVDDGLSLEQLHGVPRKLARSTPIAVGPGIYKVMSTRPITVAVDIHVNVEIVTGNDKDEVPEPKPKLRARLDPATTPAFDRAFRDFFPSARGLASPP